MIHKLINGDPLLEIVEDPTSNDPDRKLGVYIDSVEYELIKSNLKYKTITEGEVNPRTVFKDYVSYFGARSAYDKLKEIGFKFE